VSGSEPVTDVGTTAQELEARYSDFPALQTQVLPRDRVLVNNPAGDQNTAYVVDLKGPSCTCDHGAHNGQGPAVCKHISKAIMAAPSYESPEEFLARDMAVLMSDLREAVDLAQDAAEATEEGLTQVRDAEAGQAASETAGGQAQAQTATDGGGGSQAASDGPQAGGATGKVSDDVLLGQARTWLEQTAGLTDHYELERTRHAGADGVAIDPDTDSMPQGQYEGLKSTIGETDSCTFHVGFGDDPCHSCGSNDGEYYLHVSKRVLGEVDG
jgi:hypothetical protein